jgi:hypothetical protein
MPSLPADAGAKHVPGGIWSPTRFRRVPDFRFAPRAESPRLRRSDDPARGERSLNEGIR